MSTSSIPLVDRLASSAEEFTQWRRDIHRHPELGFEEHRTAKIVIEKLQEWGIETVTGVGQTGVVGILRCGSGNKAIGLRADMDALPMQELNTFEHKSCNDGVFHGCGHDGHTVMLLGAAKYLAEQVKSNTEPPLFNGTVYFVFQPAEEGRGGAKAMIDDGLFDRFPMDAIYGMHNEPLVELGHFAILPGKMMAAFVTFDIRLTGKGGHGAFPHTCVDSIVIAAELIQALQTVVSRNLNPQQAAVLSITQAHAGDAYNVIPDQVELAGGLRFFDDEVGELLKQRMQQVVDGLSQTHNLEIALTFHDAFVALSNSPQETDHAVAAAAQVVGEARVNTHIDRDMGSEDFSFFLQEKPGAYIYLGNASEGHQQMIHHPLYDFNDQALVYGVSYWVELTRSVLK